MGRCCFYTVGTLSLLLLVTSVTLLVARVFQKAVEQTIQKNIVLKNGTETFDYWETPPLPVYTQFYFFNVTNPEEILKGETPHVTEVGPYTYRELRDKENIQFGSNGTTVSAVSNKAYVFERNLSIGDPKIDLIRTLNIPVVSAMEWSQKHFLRSLIVVIMKAYQQKLFVIHTVHELLWGYKDELLSLISVFKPNISPYFGLFYGKNGTNDGDYVFLTGEDNYRNFSKIVEWNGKKSLDWWGTESCNMINGTDGDSFHPLITKDEILYVFPSDFCRSVYITFSGFENIQGLPALKYKLPAEILANTSENAGFCLPEGNCLGSGVLNVSICKNGAPIILSAPHFYQADEKFLSAIAGMHPNKDHHETFVDINPLTGIILRAAKRFQINVYVRKLDEFVETGNIQTLVFPVMYLNESVLIDKETADRLKAALNTTVIVTNIPYIIMALGVFFGLIFIGLVCRGQGSMDEGTPDERAPLIRT
ncbi:PREDICTED: lysosome membrane protein 2 isoform X1 [Chrysochloris asiatica]|uniref:Lysosome membrane protein 2 isoform X1 n=1 Tax=Chrysochloris asiatica TaxID=185453 RepID=A0A9B0TWK5_CHRAS|nr:PREDICTED: lysosome membrane protein 2 isoform X1 [Chrysochloris asiatica]